MSLTRQEVFQALADGKDVELKHPSWGNYKNIDHTSYERLNSGSFNNYEWRVRLEPPKWYEDIPEHGVLCWYGGKYHELPVESRCLTIIVSYDSEYDFPFKSSTGARYEKCLPLTNEEIKQFLQGEEDGNIN